jgi:hypothetical protein
VKVQFKMHDTALRVKNWFECFCAAIMDRMGAQIVCGMLVRCCLMCLVAGSRLALSGKMECCLVTREICHALPMCLNWN